MRRATTSTLRRTLTTLVSRHLFGNVLHGNLTGEEKSLWQRTSSFAGKYFSDDNLAGHPLSMTFRKESVPEIFAEPAAASSSSETERQSAKPTDILEL